MAYEDAPARRDWLDSSGVYKRYGTKTNAFGATGASEKRLAVHNMATSYNYERPTSGHLAPVEDFRGFGSMSPIPQGEEYRGIEFQDAMRECQPDATNSKSDNPWSPWRPLGFHEVTEDQRMFAPHEESYGQPCPFQLRLESSFESAPNQFDGDDSGYAESSAEVSDQLTHSDTSK
ncbi:hypothetical protein AG0111_0g10127 [Alternaria gaisen]|uniref:Uncharacterized protein n=1 Tax=Alternaria gaisen TaxID=167740 RepID=A0ACB6FAC5_9PLEO|nr:hypothetical protein AG0111_0g10127 [Alternaria gaisen]